MDTHALSRSIAALAADRAIREGLARFSRLIDSRSWSRMGDVFAEDLTFNYGTGEQIGLSALTGTMASFLDNCGPTQHLIGSVSVELDVTASTALSRAYVQARHQRPNDPTGAIFDSNGEYVDRWAELAGGWKIVRRDVSWSSHSGDPAILGIGKEALA